MSNKHHKLRLAIPLDEEQRTLVTLWLDRFLQNAVHLWSTPTLEGQYLLIHPADFPNLLSFAQPGDCTEIEFYRIRKIGSRVVASACGKRARFYSLLKEMVLNSLEGLSPASQNRPSLGERDSDTILIDEFEKS